MPLRTRPLDYPAPARPEDVYFPRVQPFELSVIPWAESDQARPVRGDAAVLWVCVAVGLFFAGHALF